MKKVHIKTLVMASLLALMCLSGLSQATLYFKNTIYKTVHADGTVTYSDQPSDGAVEVVLDVPTNTISSSVPTPTIQAKTTVKQKTNYVVSILNPQPEATIRNNAGEISIGVSIEPKTGGFFQLHINEQIHESATGMFKLSNMDRGAYQYSVKFIDNSGKVIASSEPRNLYLHQASALIN